VRRDWPTNRRLGLTAVVLAALVIAGGGIWLLRGLALRATYRAEPGKLTVDIEAGLMPTERPLELPPARYITDFPPLLEIPRTSDSDDAGPERGQALKKYNAAVRAINAHSASEQQKWQHAASHPEEPVAIDPPPPPLPPLPMP